MWLPRNSKASATGLIADDERMLWHYILLWELPPTQSDMDATELGA
jgi:hypothetical protein